MSEIFMIKMSVLTPQKIVRWGAADFIMMF